VTQAPPQGDATTRSAAEGRLSYRRRLVAAVCLATVLALALIGSRGSEAQPRAAAAAEGVTLKVIVTGNNGQVAVSGAESGSTEKTQDSDQSCRYATAQGQEVTLTPVDPTGFVGWSVYECPDRAAACTVTMDSDRTVVATFTPTSLTVVVEGEVDGGGESGSVKTADGSINCSGNGSCRSAQYAAFAEVTLTAAPADEFDRWNGACQEAGTSPTCTLLLSGDDVVGAKFKDDLDVPSIIPPRQQAELEVAVEPSGAGTVSSNRSRLSEAISCSPTCSARFEQGENPTLTAEPADGFVEWRGGAPYCTTNPVCRYPAFRTTSIQAVFRAEEQEQPPPPPPPPARCEQQVAGTPGADRIDGGPGGDVIRGLGGNDRIRGLGGPDCLFGGNGSDTLNGGPGDDAVLGGAGADTLTGGAGRDRLNGGPGPDRILAADGARDVVVCGAGRDSVRADRVDALSGCERVTRAGNA
jgi:hypothetical protein